MKTTRKRINTTRIDLVLDTVIFVAFLIATAPRFSGLAVHEWLGIAFGAAIVTHLLLHWRWIVETTRRVFRKLPAPTRINHVLNILLFVDITILTFSGLIISRVALPALGITPQGAMPWRVLHVWTTDIGVLIIGLHVALHWSWVVSAVKRYILSPALSLVRGRQKEVRA